MGGEGGGGGGGGGMGGGGRGGGGGWGGGGGGGLVSAEGSVGETAPPVLSHQRHGRQQPLTVTQTKGCVGVGGSVVCVCVQYVPECVCMFISALPWDFSVSAT